MRAIILAGGMGIRLRERVSDLPKPMAPIAGRPFLEYLLDRLAHAGISTVTLSVGYKWEVIRDHFGTSYRDIEIDYAIEAEPLGTGGALLHALGHANAAPVLALNGDSLLDLDFAKLRAWYEANPAPIAMVVRSVPDIARYGSVSIENGHITGFYEKGPGGPGCINAGIYCLQPGIFADYRDGNRFSFEQDILQRHCAELNPRAWCSDAYFIDIGIPEDFDRAQTELPLLTLDGCAT